MPRFGSRKLALSGWHHLAGVASDASPFPTRAVSATERKTGRPSMLWPCFKTNNNIIGHSPGERSMNRSNKFVPAAFFPALLSLTAACRARYKLG
jgi:hypothetical protein